MTTYAFSATKLYGPVSTHDNNFLRSAAQVGVSPAVETGRADGIAEQYLNAQVRGEGQGIGPLFRIIVGPLFIRHPDDIGDSDAERPGDNGEAQRHARTQLGSELTKHVSFKYLMPGVFVPKQNITGRAELECGVSEAGPHYYGAPDFKERILM